MAPASRRAESQPGIRAPAVANAARRSESAGIASATSEGPRNTAKIPCSSSFGEPGTPPPRLVSSSTAIASANALCEPPIASSAPRPAVGSTSAGAVVRAPSRSTAASGGSGAPSSRAVSRSPWVIALVEASQMKGCGVVGTPTQIGLVPSSGVQPPGAATRGGEPAINTSPQPRAQARRAQSPSAPLG